MNKNDKDCTIHEKHRERLRTVYKDGGIDSMQPHQVLELMLFNVIPRKDTNPIAHRLINTFGSFYAVLDADIADLEKVEGVGSRTAVFIKLFSDVFRYYEKNKVENRTKDLDISDIGRIMKPSFAGLKNETAYILCLDSSMNILANAKISDGKVNGAYINFRQISEIALRCNANFLVLAHNHPNATAIPSQQDIDLTKDLQRALSYLNIVLFDHLIFSGIDGDYISLAQSGYL